MSGIIIEPFTSVEAAERNFARLNEAVVALQGGSIAIENIEGYENLATKLDLEEAIETVQYAVGDIHITEDEQDPAEKFGYGEWEIISRGHVLAGIDVPPEDDPEYEPDQDFQTPGQTGGEKEVTLTVEQMPSHSHTISNREWAVDGGAYAQKTWNDSPNSPAVINNTDAAGGGQPHNNLQPYYCVYIWKRVS